MGFDLFGPVDAATFDACQPRDQRLTRVLPRCGTAIVLGTAGVQLDSHTVEVGLQRVSDRLRVAGHRTVIAGTRAHKLSFPRLADAAGFGTVSPVTGLLLHPKFGPWLRVHDVLLVEGRPFGQLGDASISDSFQPCCKCDGQPCLEPPQAPVLDPVVKCPIGKDHHCHSAPPLQWPAHMPMSPMTRFAVSALRFVPQLFRFRR
ncbi:MAG: hypothetical protein KDE27_11430 [Planctomycetes bacterium]|nr:hypothetical protein [Planctomycetota bacterium]